MNTMTIVEFLNARIAEDEALIDATEEWVPGYTPPGLYTFNSYLVSGVAISAERLTAECEAKRSIVGRGILAQGDASTDGVNLLLHDVLRLLAQTYRNHPDFQQEWL
jgi:hypothetical protein